MDRPSCRRREWDKKGGRDRGLGVIRLSVREKIKRFIGAAGVFVASSSLLLPVLLSSPSLASSALVLSSPHVLLYI